MGRKISNEELIRMGMSQTSVTVKLRIRRHGDKRC